jgi:mono/diheme cytochrome c family protein
LAVRVGLRHASHHHIWLRSRHLVDVDLSLVGAKQPLAGNAGQDRSRREVYNNNCQNCHGEQLVNTGQTFDLRRLTTNDRARFDNSVRNGKNQMSPWKDVLSTEEIDQVWGYIRSKAYQH